MFGTATGSSSAPQFTIAAAASAAAAAVPDRELIIQGERRTTYGEIADRSARLAAYLRSRGLGCHTERSELAGHEVGQDMIGVYAYNGPEYVEAILGALGARVAPFNVNYRYVRDELRYLLTDAGANALIYHATFAPAVAEILPELPGVRVLLQIADDSGNALLDGAVDYETAVAGSAPDPAAPEPSPDDLLVVYTGGTTGMPKGVLWRQHDLFLAACGGRDVISGEILVNSIDEIGARAAANPAMKIMVLPPLIHGAAQWATLTAITLGQTIVYSPVVEHFDAEAIVRTIERERVAVLTLVGDAMARPLLAAAESTGADISSLVVLSSGGAILSPQVKERWIAARPGLLVLDAVGSSETGVVLNHMSTEGAVSTGRFSAGATTRVVAEDFSAVLDPGAEDIGWLAQQRHTPLGYLGDAAKTARTFPVIDGVRYALPGDRARHLADGTVELLGRDAVTINSGGEKVFAEEVELALCSHPAVEDVLVVGRTSERWGQEVVAIVVPAGDAEPDAAALIEHAGRSIARYKLPKLVLFRAEIRRSAVGKADYRWARAEAEAASAES
ncbi:acyl-CoA synthetase [Nocardia sp. NPDC057227]|uniref:acyl-CoA synthetase n=1 Tax=Nocardia sp. NPDC057227 TaxID=3346056 RepID=UPI00363EF26B